MTRRHKKNTQNLINAWKKLPVPKKREDEEWEVFPYSEFNKDLNTIYQQFYNLTAFTR